MIDERLEFQKIHDAFGVPRAAPPPLADDASGIRNWSLSRADRAVDPLRRGRIAACISRAIRRLSAPHEKAGTIPLLETISIYY